MAAELLSTSIPGVFELYSQPFEDHRGAFLNAFRLQDPVFQEAWGDRPVSQVNVSRTEAVGTVRGMHLQLAPHAEAKLVRALRGRVWDVAVDLRETSSTFGCWHAVELSAEQGNALMIPEGCAHGFQVLEASSEMLYLHSGSWIPGSEGGIRWDDATLSIDWPKPVSALSERDQLLPYLELNP